MKTINFVFFCLLAVFSLPANAVWMANADFSACPRKYIADTKGSEGPFNLESECLARVRQVEGSQSLSCARYSCVNQSAASGGTGATAQAGHELDEHINKAIAAGIQGKISPTDAVGLVSLGLLGNALLAPSQPQVQVQKTPAEIEADRVATERYAIEYARREREREDAKDGRVAPMLALLDPIPTLKSNYYGKGFEHASQCISQNAGPSCSGASNEQMQACLDDYRAGYEAGTKEKTMTLDEAFRAGELAGATGELANAASDARSSGPCRTEWIESYNRGHFQGKAGKSVK